MNITGLDELEDDRKYKCEVYSLYPEYGKQNLKSIECCSEEDH